MSDHALVRPPLIFARHGARAHVEANTPEAFVLAWRLGATGLALDAWRLASGSAVVAPGPSVRIGWRRRAVDELDGDELPPGVVRFAAVVAEAPRDATLLVAPADRGTAETLAADATRAGVALWLLTDDPRPLADLRAPGVRVIVRERLARLKEGPERHAATLAAGVADGVLFPQPDWTGGLTALYHRFGVLAVASEAQHERVLRELVRMGVDAIVTDWPDRAVDAMG